MAHFGNRNELGQTAAAAIQEPPRDSAFQPRPNYTLVSSVLVALILLASGAAQAKSVTALSPSLVDVSRAIASAADNDTVVIPAGTASWTVALVITKGITLQGQTTTNSVAGTSVDSTVIEDSVGGTGPTPVIQINSVAGKTYRVTGITFTQGTRKTTNSNGMVWLGGFSHSVRVDHCHFKPNKFESRFIGVNGAIWGVADHNVMESANTQSFNIRMHNWPSPGGAAASFGDGSWAAPTNFGSQEFFFIEDNYIKNVTGTSAFPAWNQGAGNLDGTFGGRYVFRHNHCYENQILNHGTFGGRERGIRAIEIYNNDFHYSHLHSAGACNSGTIISHDNTWDGVQPSSGIVVEAYRVFAGSPIWGGGSGDNPWDLNETANGPLTENGFSYNPVNGLYASGTAASGSNKSTIVDPTKNWKPNQWVNFAVKRVVDNTIAQIDSNTSNTLTVYCYNQGTSQANWVAGDRYEIRRPLTLLDQPGRGQGDLITGSNPINKTTGKATWPKNALEPLYSWNNKYTRTGASVNILVHSSAINLVKQGRDYYNNTPMPNYTPYTYPHPLVSGLAPPSNLTIVP